MYDILRNMPILKSAIKKLRSDKRRADSNVQPRTKMKNALKRAHSEPSALTIRNAYSTLDRAVKNKLVLKNTAARLKSRLLKFAKGKLKTSPFTK